jgi:hypothetical protein
MGRVVVEGPPRASGSLQKRSKGKAHASTADEDTMEVLGALQAMLGGNE